MAFNMKNKKDLTSKMTAAAKTLDNTKVQVGVTGDENIWLAGIHEYGMRIKVTPEMRAYLHRIGVHLKRTTTEIVIPERSFIRAGYDDRRDKVIKSADRILPDVLAGYISVDDYLKTVGKLLRGEIQEYADDLSYPPKKPWPGRDPNKNNPLVMTGDMIASIEYEVIK